MAVHISNSELPGRDIENFFQIIEAAVNETSPAVSNQKVTAAHYVLSEALQKLTGEDAGPNFHSWAVWGSKKAGVTIRQEDLDSALKNATVVSGLVGFIAGLIAAAIVVWLFISLSIFLTFVLILIGGIIGAVTGALTGRVIARYSRAEAARLILEGNQTVLEDIGGKTARFVADFKDKDFKPEKLNVFYDGFVRGKTSDGGQNLLKEAFRAYTKSAISENKREKRQWSCFGNCLAILHEHIRLQPYISKSLPFIIRRCVTQRMMSFDIGEVSLCVSKEFSTSDNNYPVVELKDEQKERLIELMKQEYPLAKADSKVLFDETKSYAADNWTSIEQRMRYIWKLFERFHLEPQVRSKPF